MVAEEEAMAGHPAADLPAVVEVQAARDLEEDSVVDRVVVLILELEPSNSTRLLTCNLQFCFFDGRLF